MQLLSAAHAHTCTKKAEEVNYLVYRLKYSIVVIPQNNALTNLILSVSSNLKIKKVA